MGKDVYIGGGGGVNMISVYNCIVMGEGWGGK